MDWRSYRLHFFAVQGKDRKSAPIKSEIEISACLRRPNFFLYHKTKLTKDVVREFPQWLAVYVQRRH